MFNLSMKHGRCFLCFDLTADPPPPSQTGNRNITWSLFNQDTDTLRWKITCVRRTDAVLCNRFSQPRVIVTYFGVMTSYV